MKILRILGKKGRITIPFEIRKEVGFKYNDVLSFVQADNNTVIIRRERICDEGCPMYNEYNPNTKSSVSLAEYLDSLTAEEQRTALVHLSACWAMKQDGGAVNV